MPTQRMLWPALVLGIILFYSILLFSPNASIHWDMADVFYPAQKYISDSLHAGNLPSWAPYLSSGTPLGSDPQTGLWYPLHWLFFLIGVTPRLMAWEVATHAFLALAGTCLLSKRLFDDEICAILSGLLYACGGFFAANSTQLPLFEAATLFPWLLFTAHAALEAGSKQWIAASGLIGGLIVLTGDFDAAAYCFLGLACFVAAQLPKPARATVLLASVGVLAALIGSVVILPWLDIVAHTTRTGIDAEGVAGVNLQLPALGTILSADYLGLFSGSYSGPDDVRHAYYYGGLLAAPLAIAGLFRRQRLATLLALIAPAVWYAFGPMAGLAKALAVFPTFRDARAPVEIWFVAALGLALAAGSGASFITAGTGRKHLPYIFLALTLVDLWFWNLYRNPMVLAPLSYEQLYERPQQRFVAPLAELRKSKPFFRIWAPQASSAFGPLNGALPARSAVTYGYKFLETQRHAAFKRALPENPRLFHLLATHMLDLAQGQIREDTEALGLVSAPAQVLFAASEAEALDWIKSIDPAESSVVEARSRAYAPGTTRVKLTALEDARMQADYTASSSAFLRIAIPWSPGWQATVDGQPVEVSPADVAFMGVFVPPGTHQLTLAFKPGRFTLGGALSGLGVGICLLMLILARRKRSLAAPAAR